MELLSKYVEICCSLYLNKTIDTSLLKLLDNVPPELQPKSKACCLFDPVNFTIDSFTNNIVPSYEFKQDYLIHLKTEDQLPEVNYSEWKFPNDIWNLREPWEISIKTIAVVPLTIFAILGNLSVIRVLVKGKLTKNPINLFILNMSIADLLFALLFPWIFLVSDFYQRFVLGKYICKCDGFILVTLMLTSILSLTVISYDRLMAVLFPFKTRMERKGAKHIIYFIWIASAAFSSPLIIWRSYMERQWLDFHEAWCTENIQAMKDYWLVLVVVLVWIPLVVLTVSYSAIFFKLGTLENRHKNLDHVIPTAQIQAKSKVLKMLFLVIVAFSLCWIPFTVLIFVRNYKNTSNAQGKVEIEHWYRTLYFISHYLMFVNCALNPLIYGFKNENIRRIFSQTVLPSCCKWFKKNQASVSNDQFYLKKERQKNKLENANGLPHEYLDKNKGLHKLRLKNPTKSTPIISLNSFQRNVEAIAEIGIYLPNLEPKTMNTNSSFNI